MRVAKRLWKVYSFCNIKTFQFSMQRYRNVPPIFYKKNAFTKLLKWVSLSDYMFFNVEHQDVWSKSMGWKNKGPPLKMLVLYFRRFRTSVNHIHDVAGYIWSNSCISKYLIASNGRFLIINGRKWLNFITENFCNPILSIELWMSTYQYFSHDPIVTNTSQISSR